MLTAKYPICHYNEPAEHKFDITRQELVDFIDLAIDYALTSHAAAPNDPPLPVKKLREIARTTTQIDALAWKCYGSCGCPLTLAGVVILTDDEAAEADNPLPEQFAVFFASFDRLIGEEYEVIDSTTLTVV